MNKKIKSMIKKAVLVLDKKMAAFESFLTFSYGTAVLLLNKTEKKLENLTSPLLLEITKFYEASMLKILVVRIISTYNKSPLKPYSDKISTFLSRPELKKYAFLFLALLLAADFLLIYLIAEQRKNEILQATRTILSKKAFCSWDTFPQASAYHYIVTDRSSKKIVKEGNTSNTKAYFSPKFGKRYACKVEPVSICLK